MIREWQMPLGNNGESAVSGTTDKKVKARLNRISGQVAGIQRMVEEGRYCVDILNQIAAVRSALDALGIEILSKHLECCLLGHGTQTEHEQARPLTKEELVAEVQNVLGRFLK
jgi:DNA-binding FrmR family transcriptional regulator